MEEKTPPPSTVVVPSTTSSTNTRSSSSDRLEKSGSSRLSINSSITDHTVSSTKHGDDHFDMLRGSKPSSADGVLNTLTVNKFRWPDLGLVGRDSELEQLQECLDRCYSHSNESGFSTRELVFLEGESGTGKSFLVKEFAQGRGKKNSSSSLKKLVLQGKFDQFSGYRPISAFLEAFAGLASELGEEKLHQKAFFEFRDSLKQAFEDDKELLELLLALIPNLRSLIYDQNHASPGINSGDDNSGKEDNSGDMRGITSLPTHSDAITTTSTLHGNRHCVQQVFCKLCRVLTEHFAPVIIVLDDCQWADQASLELLEALYSDNHNSKILFVACLRPPEEDIDQLTELRNKLSIAAQSQTSSSRPSNITTLTLDNLAQEHVHTVVTTLLDSADKTDNLDKTMELSELCHKRTHGNVFFLLQFLIMLQEEGLLEFKLGLYDWKWDLALIEAKTAATENVVNMVVDRLLYKLPDDLPIAFLQLASCLGSTVNDRALALAWEHVAVLDGENVSNRPGFQETLNAAVRGNFLEPGSGDVRGSNTSRSIFGRESNQPYYHRWLHDKIQEAVMSSIGTSSSQIDAKHNDPLNSDGGDDDESNSTRVIDDVKCRVGMSLLQFLNEEELEREVFVVANLLTNTFQPSNDYFLTITIDLFLRAAEKAISLGAFQSACRYATSGISLLHQLKENAWEDDKYFDRSLRLYSIATEASGVLGSIENMLAYSNVVLNQPKCSIFDKLRVYLVKLEYLQNNGEAFAAVDLGLQILLQLGCKFPKNKAVQAVQTIKRVNMFKAKAPTKTQLRNLSPMTNRNAKEIVKVIFRLEASFYYTRQVFLYALVSMKSVELVLENGLCDYSGGAFFAVGNILAALSHDLKHLKTWCALSDLIVTKLVPNGYHQSRAIFANCCGFLWSQPTLNQPKRFLHGYKVGMKVGDTESAMWNCCHFLYYEFLGGRSLDILEERCQYYLSYMKDLKRNEAALVGAPIWRLVLNLTQSSVNTSGSTATGSRSNNVVDSFEASISQTSPVAPYFARMTKNLLHAYRREYITGADLSIQRGNEFLGNFPHQPSGIWDMCLRGVCLYAAAMNTGKRRYYGHAKKAKRTIEKWLSQGNINVRHYVALLEAEDLALRGKLNEARVSYESSIVAASRGGFIHDSAIANERYACFLMDKMHDRENAMFHFGESERLYTEWGAINVLEGLHKIMMDRGLTPQENGTVSVPTSLENSESPLRRLQQIGQSVSSSILSLGGS